MARFDKRRGTRPMRIRNMDVAVSRWLAAKITADAKRVEAGKPPLRCEAISNWSEGRPGTQCGLRATGYRDGRAVCSKHKKATDPVFVGDKRADYYEVLRGILADLSNMDSRFRKIIREVAND